VEGALVRLGDSLACVKIWGAQHSLGAEILSSKKCALGGTISHLDLQGHWTKLHRTSFAERRTNRHRRNDYPILNIFIRFGDIRRRTPKSSEIGLNFACFSPLKFFWGAPPEILDQHYKIRPSTDHRAKFHAGGPRISEISRVEKNKKN